MPNNRTRGKPQLACALVSRFHYILISSLFSSNTWYISGPVPEVSTATTLKLLSKESAKKGRTIKLTFELDGKLS